MEEELLLSEKNEQEQQQLEPNKKAKIEQQLPPPRKVPQRPYGGTLVKTNNNRLPTTVPIIGLGCSSFSTFFWPTTTKTDDDSGSAAGGGSSVGDEGQQQQQQQQNLKQKFTPETIERNHPIVETWIETIKVAILDYGINLLDTAPWYGHGTSEIVIGWAMEEILLIQDKGSEAGGENENDDAQPPRNGMISRDDIIINTKIGRYEENPMKQFDFSKEMTILSVKRSIQRMKCQYINVLQLHDPEYAPNLEQLMNETIPSMITCRSKGYCRALGMTGYPLEVQYQILQRTLDFQKDDIGDGGYNSDGPVWDQALTYGHFNLHDKSLISQPILRAAVDNDNNNKNLKKIAYKSYAEYCYTNSIGVLGAAPLSMGLLTNQGPPIWHPANNTPLADACREAMKLCDEYNENNNNNNNNNNAVVNISTIATVVALSNPQTIPCTILGMKDISEVITAAECANRYHNAVVVSTTPATTTTTTTTTTTAGNSSSDENEENEFPGRDIDSWNVSSDVLLKQVLSDTEYTVWKKLNDPNNGPFASLWKDTTESGESSYKYKWDGIQGVKEFWEQLDNKYTTNSSSDGDEEGKNVEFWQATSMQK